MTSLIHRLADTAPPEWLYKYMRVSSDEDLRRLREILIDRRLWLASPASFNDPFDCKRWIPLGGNDYHRLRWYKELIRRQHPNASRREIDDLAIRMRHDTVEEELNRGIGAAMKEKGVLCLSETKSNLLMWGHYADSHRGICRGFKVDRACPVLGRTLPVNYTQQYSSLPMNPIDDDAMDEVLNCLLLVKSREWSYEKEWRSVSQREGHRDYLGRLLEVVYLGLAMPGEWRERIHELVLACRPKPRLSQVRASRSAFALEFEELHP